MTQIASVHYARLSRPPTCLIQNARHNVYVASLSNPTRRTWLDLNPTRHQKDPKRIYFRGKILGKTIPSYLKFCKENLATSKSIHYAAKKERLRTRICGERRPPLQARTESAPNPPRVCAPAQWRLQVPKPPPPQRPGHKNINQTNNQKKTYKKLVAHAGLENLKVYVTVTDISMHA